MSLRTTLEVDTIDPALDGLEIGVPPANLLVIQGEIGRREPADEHKRAGIVQGRVGSCRRAHVLAHQSERGAETAGLAEEFQRWLTTHVRHRHPGNGKAIRSQSGNRNPPRSLGDSSYQFNRGCPKSARTWRSLDPEMRTRRPAFPYRRDRELTGTTPRATIRTVVSSIGQTPGMGL